MNRTQLTKGGYTTLTTMQGHLVMQGSALLRHAITPCMHAHTCTYSLLFQDCSHDPTNTETQLQELHTVIRSTTVSYCTVSSHSTTHYHIVTYMTLYSHCTTVLLYIVTNYASSVDTHAVHPQSQQCHHADSRVDQQVLTH